MRAPGIRTIADGLGLFAATACLVHCITLPALLIVGTALPSVFLDDEFFHQSMLWLVVPSAVVAFGLGCSRHKDRRVFFLGATGVVGLVLSATVLHELLGELAEKAATLGFAGLAIAAHLRNFRLCRSESCRHEAIN